ncbi:DUF4232 domain-containing protein [Streptomyces sp. H27-H5]|uniref:DUF4232 domain-containing protein n=1 Tax=Streptomyces sp. H27-H5 TaxID=2996460 RepID=UPI003B6329E0
MEWAVPPAKDDSKLLLTVTNTGTKPCKLRSHPVLRLENGHGRLVGVFANGPLARLPSPRFPACPLAACPLAHSPTQANSSPSSSGPRGIGAGR